MTSKQQFDYDEGINHGYQPYWILYCLGNGLDLEHEAQSLADYMDWIMKKHREFEPDEKAREKATYNREFLAWLKAEVTV